MAEYILFMHNDVVVDDQDAWEPYLQKLRQAAYLKAAAKSAKESACEKAVWHHR